MSEIPSAPERAQPLLHVIAEAINAGGIREGEPSTFIAYSEALSLLGIPLGSIHAGRRLQHAGLTDLNEWTMRHSKLPKVAALIVNKKTRRPSAGFLKSHGREGDANWELWWMREANRAISFDWSEYLSPITRHKRVRAAEGEDMEGTSRIREEGDYEQRIDRRTMPARVKKSGIAVPDILMWLASGQSTSEIIRRHPALSVEDIRASLIYAASKEKRTRKPTFSERWAGRFTLPADDPSDARLSFLLGRYRAGK